MYRTNTEHRSDRDIRQFEITQYFFHKLFAGFRRTDFFTQDKKRTVNTENGTRFFEFNNELVLLDKQNCAYDQQEVLQDQGQHQFRYKVGVFL